LAAEGQPHSTVAHNQLTASLMQVPQVSRVLVSMAGSSILGRTWSCLRVEAIDWRRRGSHIRECTLRGSWPANQRDMLANKPCRTVRPLANTLRCTWRGAWTVRHGNHIRNERHEGCHAQNAASVEGLGNIRASGRCRLRGELKPPLALSLCGD